MIDSRVAHSPARHNARGARRSDRRLLLLTLLGVLLFGPLLTFADVDARQGGAAPVGRIAYIRAGNIWIWSPDGERELIRIGNAADPRWSPDGGEILFVQNGGSFSDLIVYDFSTAKAVRITDNESTALPGSQDYAVGSAWVLDPIWSASGAIAFVSDRDSANGALRLWLMPTWQTRPALAASDQSDAGNVEGVGLDGTGTIAVYTVLALGGATGGSTYVAVRDLASGATSTLAEGPHGAFQPAISNDGQSVVVSIRDEDGMTDLWLVSRGSGELTQLTERQQAVAATWSPDGNWVAYLRPDENGFEAWALPVDRAAGTAGEPVRLFGHDDIDATSGLSWTLSQLDLP